MKPREPAAWKARYDVAYASSVRVMAASNRQFQMEMNPLNMTQTHLQAAAQFG